jgi:hypothetical protein
MEHYKTLFNARLDYLYSIVNQLNNNDDVIKIVSLRKEYLYVAKQLLDINEMISREIVRAMERTHRQLEYIAGEVRIEKAHRQSDCISEEVKK